MKENEIKTVLDLVKFGAEVHGDIDFLRFFRDDEITCKSFKEFLSDSLAISRFVKSEGSEKKHIAFVGKTSYEYVATLTGMIFSSNVVVPFDPNISVDEACELFLDADIDMLYYEEEFEQKAKEIQKRVERLEKIVPLHRWQWFEEIFSKFKTGDEPVCNPDDTVLIIYTSGTTGKRKGVMLTNSNLAINTTYVHNVMSEGDVSFSILPMHHVFCYACDVLRTLFDGGTLCLNGEMKDLYKHILRFEPTVMRIVPSVAKSMLTKIKITERKNPSMSKLDAMHAVCGKNFGRMIVGSAFMSADTINEFEKYGIKARMGYGMSECSPRITSSDFDNEKHKFSTGKIIGTDEVRIKDGEIQVKGGSVMKGYYKRPKETAEAFTEDGFFMTGDLAKMDGDYLYLTGRKKNIIVLSNGENISPEEIENSFVDEGEIKELLIVAKDDKLVAVIVPNFDLLGQKSDDEILKTLEGIVEKVNQRNDEKWYISSVEIRKEPFLRTSTGKIKRQEFYY